MLLTIKQANALEILKNTSSGSPMTCKMFARLMWPESPMHLKVSNQGRGATPGKAAWLCAGSYLSKLRRDGLVSNLFVSDGEGYYITEKGLKLLHAFTTKSGV